MESRHSWGILRDGALAIDTELESLPFHSAEFASPELCCSAMTGATADWGQACRAPGGEQDRQPPTPRGAGVVAVPWDPAGELPVRVPAVTPTSPAKICGRMRDRIRLDGAAGVPELCRQAEAGATGAGSCIAAMTVQRAESVPSIVAIHVARVEPMPKPMRRTDGASWRWSTHARRTRHLRHGGAPTWSPRRRTS